MATSAQSSDVLIRLRDLRYARGSKVIFDGVDIDIRRGQVTAIMGPSGTGKTTLLRLIGGQLAPQGGQVLFDDVNVHALRRRELFRLRRRMGMLFQSGALFTDLNVFENVAFPLREHTDLPESLIRHLVMMKLEAVGLRAARDLMPAQLSGGMARRVAMARAIALDPEMILYDEPFTGQDPITMGILVQLIRRLNDALGLTSVVVSHDVEETCAIADYVYLIADGKVMEAGPPQALRESTSEWTRQFMQRKADGPVPFHYPGRGFAEDLFEQRAGER